MENVLFMGKLRQFDYQSFLKYEGMELLQALYEYLLDTKNIKFRCSQENYWKIDNSIHEVCDSIFKIEAIQNYVSAACQITALLYMYQPFFDGNHRVCLIFQQFLLNLKKQTFSLSGNYLSIPIGILFEESDFVSKTITKEVLKNIRAL